MITQHVVVLSNRIRITKVPPSLTNTLSLSNRKKKEPNEERRKNKGPKQSRKKERKHDYLHLFFLCSKTLASHHRNVIDPSDSHSRTFDSIRIPRSDCKAGGYSGQVNDGSPPPRLLIIVDRVTAL